ncbi:MAG: guanylate kinase [Synergistaceae bacterium]|nr:guanylate kinase [Synergistaceae bacterium]
MKRGRLFILSGPSGVGKGTVRARLFQKIPNLVYSVSCTTRPPREGETEGIQYRFLDAETFRNLAQDGRFLEWASVHGHLYGTLLDDVERQLEKGNSVVLEIDVQGALQVKERVPESVMIFILPPSFQELEKRLASRGTEAKEEFETRLRNASSEIALSKRYDYAVVNDQVERAASELAEIIKKEMNR